MSINLQEKVVFAIIQIFIHLMVLYYYQQGSLVRLFPNEWSEQFVIAILLLLVISLLMLFIPWKNIRKGLFFVRMFFLMVISLPFTGNSGNFGLLYALQTFECFFYFTSKTAFGIISFYIVFLFWLVNQRVVLWNFYHPALSSKLFTFVILAFHCILGSAVGYFVDKERHRRIKEKQLYEEMYIANRCLAEANIGLQTVAVETELSSVFKERTRIAREIHDSIAYTFTNLIALLNAFLVQKQANGQEVPSEIEKSRDLALDGLRDLRQALRTLRPRDNENYNGLGCILRLIRVFKQATGIEVSLNFGDVPQYIGESLETVIYRVVQEGLTNSFRHGKATEVYISFYLIGDGVEVNIKDNGCGTDSPTGGYGLVGIHERVTELGGTVTINSKPGNGFALRIWLPLDKEGEDHGAVTDHYR
jgi:signal transduction histidine kinase